MSIYSNVNIRKILKLSPREFPHLVQNRENICSRKLWRIQYNIHHCSFNGCHIVSYDWNNFDISILDSIFQVSLLV